MSLKDLIINTKNKVEKNLNKQNGLKKINEIGSPIKEKSKLNKKIETKSKSPLLKRNNEI